MHILVTDLLACPRCGPDFGLVVLADRMEDRRVVQGSLGCANCREQYPIRDGVADLRRDPGSAGPSAPEPPADPERAFRFAALLGVTGPSRPVMVATADPGLVDEIQKILPDTGVLGLGSRPPPRVAGMGWILADRSLPLRDRSLGGIAATQAVPLDEALRTLARQARIVLDPSPAGAAEALRDAGAEILLEQDRVAVAFDPRAG